jgi:hypothetical protein
VLHEVELDVRGLIILNENPVEPVLMDVDIRFGADDGGNEEMPHLHLILQDHGRLIRLYDDEEFEEALLTPIDLDELQHLIEERLLDILTQLPIILENRTDELNLPE